MTELAEVEVLEPQRFKGKAEPVQVYRLLGLADGEANR
jgi:class 3 adenylate cyclase